MNAASTALTACAVEPTIVLRYFEKQSWSTKPVMPDSTNSAAGSQNEMVAGAGVDAVTGRDSVVDATVLVTGGAHHNPLRYDALRQTVGRDKSRSRAVPCF